MKTEQTNRKPWRLLIGMTVLCVLSVGVMLFALNRPQAGFVPPPFEENAVEGVPQDVAEEFRYSSLDDGVYTVALCGVPTADEQEVTLYFTDPAENDVWLKVRIYTEQGIMLGESGLLKPGQYVENVRLNETLAEPISVLLKVMAYEPDTYQSAGAVTLRTELKIR